jgi:hypothetical protein
MLDMELAFMGTVALVMFRLFAELCGDGYEPSLIGAHPEQSPRTASLRQALATKGNPDTFGKPSLRW